MSASLRLYWIVYNQTRIQLKSSWRLCFIVAIPFVAAAILVFYMQIHFAFQAALICVLTVSGAHLVRKICLLSHSDSIQYLDISETTITSINQSGQEIACKLNKAIISNSLCLFSVDLEEPISNKVYSKLTGSKHFVLITKLNIDDFQSFRRVKALLTMCAHKL